MNKDKNSRLAQTVCDLIKAKMVQGDPPVGALLPSIRKLMQTYPYSLKTIHRALHILVNEGYLTAEPYRGYRVMPLVNDPQINSPLVLIMSEDKKEGSIGYSTQFLFEEIKRSAERRGWSLLIISSFNKSESSIVNQVLLARAFGVILERCTTSLANAIYDKGIPVVTIDSWSPTLKTDSVTQDGQMGSIQATRYLLEKGKKKIIWFGSDFADAHREDRLSGFLTTMVFEKNKIKDQNIVFAKIENQTEKAIQILKKKPDAVIALWFDYGLAILKAAETLHLTVGKDFELVSWCMNEAIPSHAHMFFNGAKIPLITWSSNIMAESAANILSAKRLTSSYSTSPIRIKVPCQLLLKY